MIAAQQILVQFGPNENLQQEKLFSLLPGFIPDYCLTASDKALARWATLVSQAYKKASRFFIYFYDMKINYNILQSYYLKEKVPIMRVKEDIVGYAKFKWPLLFSRFYEAYRNSGLQF